ncbi:MAG: hypothetical protein ACPF9E_17675 [Alteromonas oceani]|nr:hypothetical protein [Alteromonas alba]
MMKLFVCGMLLSFACGTFARQIDTSLLVGTWGNSEDGGNTFWGYGMMARWYRGALILKLISAIKYGPITR